MFENVCVTCKGFFETEYKTKRLCPSCNLEADLKEMAVWGTD